MTKVQYGITGLHGLAFVHFTHYKEIVLCRHLAHKELRGRRRHLGIGLSKKVDFAFASLSKALGHY